MPFVKYIASNVKGGVSVNLGEKTLIVGPNGSGKSTVVNAIELALAGFASDVAGREEMSKDNELIHQLTPEHGGELFAKATLSDGTAIRWAAGGKDGKKAVHRFPEDKLDPSTVLPLRAVREAVRGNAVTARKFFLQYALPSLTMEDVLAKIPAELHANFRAATLSADINASPVDKLLLALETSASRARKSKAKGSASDEVADAVAQGLPPIPPESTIAAMKAVQKEARAALEKLLQQKSTAEHFAKLHADTEPLQAQVAQAEQNMQALMTARQQAEAQLQATPAPVLLDEHTQRVMGIIEYLATLEVSAGSTCCPVCKTVAAPGTFTQRHAAAQAYKANETAKAGPYLAAKAEFDKLGTNLASWQNHFNNLKVQLGAVQQALAAGTTQPPTEEAIAAARAKVEEAEEALRKVDALKGQWAAAAKAKDASKDAESESDGWKKLVDACTDAISDLLDSSVSKFVAQVQSYLPPQDRFTLALRDGKKAVFRFGLERDGVLHSALSGAEWARVLAAVSAVCSVQGKLAVVIPEDRAFDPDTLAKTLEAMSNAPGQVILTSAVKPTFVPAGWTVIDTSTGKHRGEEEGNAAGTVSTVSTQAALPQQPTSRRNPQTGASEFWNPETKQYQPEPYVAAPVLFEPPAFAPVQVVAKKGLIIDVPAGEDEDSIEV